MTTVVPVTEEQLAERLWAGGNGLTPTVAGRVAREMAADTAQAGGWAGPVTIASGVVVFAWTGPGEPS